MASRFDGASYLSRDPEADRARVVELHSTAVGVLAALGVLAGGMSAVVLTLRRIQIETLREQLTIAASLGVSVLGAFGGYGVRALARPVVRRLDRRFVLPRPANPVLRRLVWVSLPLAVAGTLPRRLAEGLGAVEPWLVVVTVVAVWLAVDAGLSVVASRLRRGARVLSLVGVLTFGLAFAGGAYDPGGARSRVLTSASAAGAAVVLLQDLTDFDRDGASGLFGGGDCAPWSRARGPHANEIPSNGVDENCDGEDGLTKVRPGVEFSTRLDSKLVGKRNVVWVIIDAVRADHVGFLGYPKGTTPYMDELAERSLVFEKAYTQSSATMYSIPSMLAGIDAGRIEWDMDRRPQPRALLMGERLRREGYRTSFIGTRYFPTMLPRLTESFEDVRIGSNEQTKSAPEAAALAVQVIEASRADERPFFLTLYFAAPHLPYVAHRGGYPAFGTDEKGKYDGEIAHTDRHLGFVVDVLEQRPDVWEDTILIVTSDHGEEFREHGDVGHARTCHVESTHVPLLVRVPGVAPKRVETPVALVDVAPMLIELLGLPRADVEPMTGKSLLATALEPPGAVRPISCAIAQKSKGQPPRVRRSIRLGKWTYYEELSPSTSTALFDTSLDPDERTPLALDAEAGSVAKDLAELAEGFFTGNMNALDFKDL